MGTDIASLLPDMTPWQKRVAEAFLSGEYRSVTVAIGRANGRRAADRIALAAAVAMSGHVHVCGRDGLWCVTDGAKSLGSLLWERVR